jgi:hypothetical protein
VSGWPGFRILITFSFDVCELTLNKHDIHPLKKYKKKPNKQRSKKG